MDRDYAIEYIQSQREISREAAERKLDRLILIYEPELDALRKDRDTSLTFAEEAYFLRILGNEK